MTTTPRWVQLEPGDYEKGRRKTRRTRGVEVQIIVSPYDIPTAVRGRYDEKLGRFVIEFRYIDDEPWDREEFEPHVFLRLGESSGRVAGVEVDVDALNVSEVQLKLGAVRQALSHAKKREQRRWDNYDIAFDVLRGHHDEIVRGALAAPPDRQKGATAL